MASDPFPALKKDALLERAGILTAVLLAGSVAGFFAMRGWHGLWFIGFNDETEHFPGGWALSQGARL